MLSPEVIKYIKDDASSWEGEPIKRIAAEGQLMAYAHNGFWYAMDTLRDKMMLDHLWEGGRAPWKVW